MTNAKATFSRGDVAIVKRPIFRPKRARLIVTGCQPSRATACADRFEYWVRLPLEKSSASSPSEVIWQTTTDACSPGKRVSLHNHRWA